MAPTDDALGGLRVLVTRPGPAAAELCAALSAAGAVPVAFPALAIEPVPPGDASPEGRRIAAALLEFDRVDIALFVSVNAVHAGMDWLEHYWPQLPVGVQWLGVGQATARALEARGVAVADIPGRAENSEALLALPALQQVSGRRALIFRGSGGRPHLAEALRARGARVDYCEVYRRALPVPQRPLAAVLAEAQVQALTAASGETLENMLTLAGDAVDALRALPVVVPGERVAGLARARGFRRVLVAVNASAGATVEALRILAAADEQEKGESA